MASIAIDGPAGAGKSTLAKMTAKKLGYIYVDTGALYRTIGLFALKKSVNMSDETAMAGLLLGARIELKFVGGEQRVFLNDEDVTGKIRTEQVSMAASAVGALAAVRGFLLSLQRDIAAKNSVVMDGRDIGTVILPNAEVKIFLTASPEERARRRYDELISKGISADYDAVLADLIKRDYDDTHREVAPLKKAEDAVEVDTTGCSLEQAADKIFDVVKEKLGE